MKKKIIVSVFSIILLFIVLTLNSSVKAVEKTDISKLDYLSVQFENSKYTFEYTGSEIKPKVVKVCYWDKNNKMIELKSEDYTISYENNINIGYGQVVVTGKGNYTGTYKYGFTICKYDIANAVTPDIPNQAYTGKSINPTISSVTYKTKDGTILNLKENIDYEIIKYTTTTQVGVATVTLNGKGDFGGCKFVHFNVMPSPTKNLKVQTGTNYFKLTWDKSLENIYGYQIQRKANGEKDFKILYNTYAYSDNNSNTYTDSQVVSGKEYTYRVRAYVSTYNSETKKSETLYGPFSNQVKKAFIGNTTLTVTSYNDSAKLSWKKVNGAGGYQIARATIKNGEYKVIKTLSGNGKVSYTDKSVKKFTKYYYKVRAYTTISSNKVYGTYSGAKEKSALQKANLTKIKFSNKKITINWSKIKSISGYEISRATEKNGKYKKVATINNKKTSYTDKNITIGKAYFYKVRAYKKSGKTKLYGHNSGEKHYATGTRKQQMNKIKLVPDQSFKNSGFSSYYKDYESLIKKYAKSKKTTYDKVNAMYKFLVTHLYHKDGYHCKNFAGTFASMCRVIGLDAYCATGQTRTSGGKYTAHTWTVININETEYIFDASLERHNSDRNKGKVQNKYFFKKYSELKGVYKQQGYENMFPYFMVTKSELLK